MQTEVRAWRQAVLWLLRSLYVLRMGLAYMVMVRGRQAEPDLVHALFVAALFVDMGLFLLAFFAWEPRGRQAVTADLLLRPLALGLTGLGAWLWLENPALALGSSRPLWAAALLFAEFCVLPMVTFGLAASLRPASGTAS